MRPVPDTELHSRAEPELQSLGAPLWQRKWLILLIVVASTAGTYVASSTRTQRFRASSAVLVQNSAVRGILNEPLLTSPERATADQAVLIASTPVAERVVRKLRLTDSPSGLLADVSAKEVTGSNVVTVTAERSSAAGAARLADAFVGEHISLRSELLRSEVRQEIGRARRRLVRLPATVANEQERQILRDGIARLSIAESVPSTQDRQVSAAVVPTGPVGTHPARDALFAFVISALLAAALSYALSYWRGGSRASA